MLIETTSAPAGPQPVRTLPGDPIFLTFAIPASLLLVIVFALGGGSGMGVFTSCLSATHLPEGPTTRHSLRTVPAVFRSVRSR